MTTIRKLFLILTVLGVLMIMMTLPAVAQTTGEVELVGTVEAMTLDTITVNGQEIDVTTAQVNISIEVGTVVKVEGVLNPDGSISAREVNVADEALQPGEAEIIGILDSFDGGTMVVNGLTIDVSGAEINPSVAVGEMVKVHATATDTGTWVAREVEAFVPVADDGNNDQPVDGEFEITGTLQEVGSDSIVVSGQTISIVGAEVKDALVVGVLVKVHVSLINGELIAREVENAFVQTNDNSPEDNSNDNTDDNSGSSETAISAEQAIEIVLAIYPNTTVTEINLDDKFGGTLVWEIHTSHGIELTIDAQTGVILTIDTGDDNSGVPADNGNSNTDDNPGVPPVINSNDNAGSDDAPGTPDDHGNDNTGSDDHEDDNNDDHSGVPPVINGNDNHDDDSGVPPVINGNDNNDDHGGDDNSGSGSDDDNSDDDNSGMGSSDDNSSDDNSSND